MYIPKIMNFLFRTKTCSVLGGKLGSTEISLALYCTLFLDPPKYDLTFDISVLSAR